MIEVTLMVNAGKRSAIVAPQTTLLELLRDHFSLTGVKSGCEAGDCGACTVLIDGEARNACLTLAAQADGCEVVTIEGLATRSALHPLQAAFESHAALQCGFCGPGVILSAKALLDREPRPDERLIREALAGHLCRCTGYAKMVEAVQEAARTMSGDGISADNGPPSPHDGERGR